MEIDCGINCFSPELIGSLVVDHHRSGFFSDCTDHSFGNPILQIGIWSTWLVWSTSGHEDKSEGLIGVFSRSIVAPEALDLVSHRVYSGVK